MLEPHVIQRRVSKLIPGLRDLSYEERLSECGLTNIVDAKIEYVLRY